MADEVDSLLADNEKLVIEVKQHRLALVPFALQPIIILICALVVGAISISFSGEDQLIQGVLDTLIRWLAIGLLVVAAVWLPLQVVRWKTRRYMLTDRRVIESSGLMRMSTIDAGLDRITDVGHQQSWLGARLGYGDISVVTASGAPIRLDQIIGAGEFKQAIMDAQASLIRERAAMMMGGGPEAAQAVASASVLSPVAAAAGLPPTRVVPPAVGSTAIVPPKPADEPKASTPTEITATLAGLTDMKEAGTITEADFEAKKKELLDRL